MTVQVTIDSGCYLGSFWIVYGGERIAGPFSRQVTIALGPGSYAASIEHGANLHFQITDDSAVSKHRGLKQEAEALVMNCAPVRIDPGRYAGTFSIRGAESHKAAGPRTLELPVAVVAATEHEGYIIDLAHGAGIRFGVGSEGRTEVHKEFSGAIDACDRKVKFQTTRVVVVPKAHNHAWSIEEIEPELKPGERSVRLVKHVSNYQLAIAPSVGKPFRVTCKGAPDPSEIDILSAGKQIGFWLRK